MERLHLIRHAVVALCGVIAFGTASAQAVGDGTLPGSNSGSVEPSSPMARTPGKSDQPAPPASAPQRESPDAAPPAEPEPEPYVPDTIDRAADPDLRDAPRGPDPGNMTSPTDPEAGAIQIEGETAPANPTR